MSDLTEKWKNGDQEALLKLISEIETADNRYSLGDEYLKEKGLMTREEYGAAGEYPYGIVMVISDYILPYLKELQELKSKRDKLAYDLGVADTKNGELLRLLKECQEIIEWYKADCGYKDLPTESVLTKIRKVLK